MKSTSSTTRDQLAPKAGQPARLSAIPDPATFRVVFRDGFGAWHTLGASAYRLAVAGQQAALTLLDVPRAVEIAAEYRPAR